jgi:tight adherence protein C
VSTPVSTRLDDRQSVLILAHPVSVGQLLSARDLRQAALSKDVDVVPASESSTVLGRPLAYSLPAGTWLSRIIIGAPATPAAGQAEAAMGLTDGQFPPSLVAGARVAVLDQLNAAPEPPSIVEPQERIAGLLLPDLSVRRDAARCRADFRLALSAYLNLIRINLAGDAGVEGALTDAASVGRGWSFTQLRRALTTAKLTRTSPWSTLRSLGEELDIRELAEPSASVSLAGTEGAKVRASLRAKVAALRTRELTAIRSPK